MHVSETSAYTSQERALFDPPAPTVKQEEVSEYIKRYKQIDKEVLELLDEKDEIGDRLNQIGILM